MASANTRKEEAQQQLSAVSHYFKEVRSEMSKVVWPTREQVTNLTLVVLGVMISMAIFLGLMDFLFNAFIQLLISMFG